MRTVGRNRWPALMLCVTLLSTLVLLAQTAGAVEIPPSGAQAFVQTSGPQAQLNVGDFYTSSTGGNDANGHEFRIYVPCQWPTALPITFSIFDPEVAEPDPLVDLNNPDAVQADDEIRNAANQDTGNNNVSSDTSFTLTAPNGASVSKTFTPNGGTNRRWVELQTFTVDTPGYGCGTYSMRAATGGNDDNAYVLRAANNSTCTVTPGTCSAVNDQTSNALGARANNVDNPDAQNGTGDELVIGMQRTSFQQYPLAPGAPSITCQNFYTFVSPTIGSVTFNNFDLDARVNGSKTVKYFPPAGSEYKNPEIGTLSGNAVWNNPPTPGTDANGVPLRGGDTYRIQAQDAGWWTIEVCVEAANPPASAKNQYIIESSAGVLFLAQPSKPQMTLSKTDGVDEATRGQTLAYVITFANDSNTTATPGTAYNVVLTDRIPIGTTYQTCAIDAPYTGTCAFANDTVTYQLNETVPAGATGTVRVSVKVNDDAPARLENLAEVTYGDNLGNRYPPKRAVDIDTVPAPVPPNAVTLASFTATRSEGAIMLAWRTTAEVNSTGFYVLRSASGGPEAATRISPLIRAVGTNGGASYQWADTDPIYGATYWLEERDGQGTVTRYGPVKAAATVAARYSVLVPLAGSDSGP